MVDSECLLKAEKVSLCFQSQRVLDGVSLSILPKQIVTLIGPNGAGKTTLVQVLLGLMKPDQGFVTPKKDLRIGYVPQRFVIGPEFPLTVQRFLQFATRSSVKIAAALREVGLKLPPEQSMQSLSGGEFRRVLLARALLKDPQLIVLDEPLQGVDITGQAEIYRLIANIRRERGCSILLVSHDLHFVMATTDQVICLNHHICCFGHPEAVSQHPEFLALFGREELPNLAIYTHSHDHQH